MFRTWWRPYNSWLHSQKVHMPKYSVIYFFLGRENWQGLQLDAALSKKTYNYLQIAPFRSPQAPC